MQFEDFVLIKTNIFVVEESADFKFYHCLQANKQEILSFCSDFIGKPESLLGFMKS